MKIILLAILSTLPFRIFAGASGNDINNIEGRDFERLTGIRGSGTRFVALRTMLGAFEALDQIRLVLPLPEKAWMRITNSLICRPVFGLDPLTDTADNQATDDATSAAATQPEPLDLAHPDSTRLEEIPGLDSRLARRIVLAAGKGGLQERWQLLAVRGITPSLYARIRRYFRETSKRNVTTSWANMTLGGTLGQTDATLRMTLEGGVSAALRYGLGMRWQEDKKAGSPRGWFGSGQRFSPLATTSGCWLAAGSETNTVAVLLGSYRIRTPLGLISGGTSFSDGIGRGRKKPRSNAIVPSMNDNAESSLTGGAVSLRPEPFAIHLFVSRRTLFADERKLQGARYDGSLSGLLAAQKTTGASARGMINENIAGVLGDWHAGETLRVGTGFIYEKYSHGFEDQIPASRAATHLRGSLAASLDIDNCLFFSELALARAIGADSRDANAAGQPLALLSGIRFERGDTVLGLVHEYGSTAPVGLRNQNALGTAVVNGLEMSVASRMFSTISAALKIFRGEKNDREQAGEIEGLLEWKPLAGLTLELSGSAGIADGANGTRNVKTGISWRDRSGLTCSIRTGARYADGSGIFLSCLLAFRPAARTDVCFQWSGWSTGRGVSVWPGSPVLGSAGDAFGSATSGCGNRATVLVRIPFFDETLTAGLRGSRTVNRTGGNKTGPTTGYEFSAGIELRL